MLAVPGDEHLVSGRESIFAIRLLKEVLYLSHNLRIKLFFAAKATLHFFNSNKIMLAVPFLYLFGPKVKKGFNFQHQTGHTHSNRNLEIGTIQLLQLKQCNIKVAIF